MAASNTGSGGPTWNDLTPGPSAVAVDSQSLAFEIRESFQVRMRNAAVAVNRTIMVSPSGIGFSPGTVRTTGRQPKWKKELTALHAASFVFAAGTRRTP